MGLIGATTVSMRRGGVNAGLRSSDALTRPPDAATFLWVERRPDMWNTARPTGVRSGAGIVARRAVVPGRRLRRIELFTALVAVAAIGGLLAVRRSVPFSVALLLAGIAIGAVLPPGTIPVSSDLILAVLIPGLVFEAAYKLDTTELWTTNQIVAVLAVPGVLITAAVVALVAWATTGLDPALGFLLGAAVSATDPVAVDRPVQAPRRPSPACHGRRRRGPVQ